MPHVTNLVLALNFKADALDMSGLHLPTLIAIDITVIHAPLGVIRFVARHSELVRLHLRFLWSFPVRKLLGRPTGSPTEEGARLPLIEHLHIYDIHPFKFLKNCIKPSVQIRRLDLHSQTESAIFKDEFYDFLKSFTALMELSFGICIRYGYGNVKTLSVSSLRKFLGTCNDHKSLRAMHISDVLCRQLDTCDIETIKPFPPSLQYISWGHRRDKATYRILGDAEFQAARAVVCEVLPSPHEIMYDWTGENTLRHLFID
ncbi:hypothetical protein SCHPADRAFT_943584 [Schizopora paradoxa]|uniref:F-box domain-containing protein n=1 Tax=Schizopora paradoxa TaxID=27342 RepID=A0A0H2RJB2_9AGAM|nr:hypothetical protein SCHPADRAFT_943584 [Schizopora paradoxa]